MRMNARVVALGAGVFFISLAIFVQGLLPFLHPESRTTDVTRVVRTDLGELKWMRSDATDYSEREQLGRQVYIREGCWYCHSQFVRPVTGETRRWGPVSEAGEYAFDVPHLFSTRRIGPDLTRVGLKYSDEWHLAHFWDPRMLTPDFDHAEVRRGCSTCRTNGWRSSTTMPATGRSSRTRSPRRSSTSARRTRPPSTCG